MVYEQMQENSLQWHLLDAQKQLNGFVENPSLDARLLMQAVLKFDHASLISNQSMDLNDEQVSRFMGLIARRLKGEPVHRILGKRSFYGRDFKLNRATLEPRADTEILIDCVLAHAQKTKGEDAPYKILDLGTGTGAIGITLLKELQNASAVLTDLSFEALECAKENAKIHGVLDRLEFRHGSYFQALEVGQKFDLLVSNPPYIAHHVVEELSPEVKNYDPALALDGGNDGLDAYRELIPKGQEYLHEGGLMALEFGYDQGDQLEKMAQDALWQNVEIHRDYGGNQRVLVAMAQ